MASLLSLSTPPTPSTPTPSLLSLCTTPDQSNGPTPVPVPQTGPITPVPVPQSSPITPVPVPRSSPISPILTDETLSSMTNVLFNILIKEFSVHSDVGVYGVSWCIRSLCLLAEATHLLLGTLCACIDVHTCIYIYIYI
jgi:hypothetical protein